MAPDPPDAPDDGPRGERGRGAGAAALLPLLGGAGNLTSVTNCMTRLRVTVRDPSAVRRDELRALPGVLGIVEDGTALQIVLGPGAVAKVAPELARHVEAATAAAATGEAVTAEAVTGEAVTAEALAERGAALRAERKARNATPAKEFLRRIAQIFIPLIPALIGCGIVAGLAGLLANLRWLPALAPALTACASGFMSLIAVFVGYNTAKEFGGTPVLGGAVAAIIVFPGVDRVSAFGEKLVPGQGGVLGALAAALLAAHVERWCRRRVPEALDVLVTPTVTVLVTGLVTLYGLMYAAGEVATATGRFADWLLANGGAAAGCVLGGLFLPLVMLGLHQALIPIHTTLIQQQGSTVLLPILAMAGAGQVGAALALYVRLSHNTSVRRTIRSAMPAGLLGIGEPLIYGVSLPLGRPFVTACIGGAFGGAFVGLLGQLGDTVGSTAIGPSGWALFPLLQGGHGPGRAVAVYGAGLLVGYAAGFAATYAFGLSRRSLRELNAERAAEHAAEKAAENNGPRAAPPA
ncbi:PTS alpha-glucoside transporter subunit IIA [Streptomyces rectiverticillatus]|uniref:PTS transporter subunit EIIC n=1 Tax=Streptomyces rectiverticillatus TaxID=173860 RepID=UPI0015C2DE7D|nr:PTS transporter subunit EIIC [Streptomyces rectiverticillatus]QLE73463.1 PTS alpha-glucoside transporter subunit IIA [Streptomyces rectiverticillatus]